MMKKLLALLLCSLAFSMPTAFADSGTMAQYGNTVYDSNGNSYTTYGNTTYGKTTYSSTGNSYTTYGNNTYGSDGSSASVYGNTVYYSAPDNQNSQNDQSGDDSDADNYVYSFGYAAR